MQRRALAPRPDWQARVQDLGLVWQGDAAEPYWDESACYVFSPEEIATLEKATAELYRLFVEAGDHIVAHRLFDRFAIPDFCHDAICHAWETEPRALNHGRFDLGYDGTGAPKLFEFNCDTPTSLLEAAVIQWDWKEAVFPRADQFNSLHEALVDRWREIAPHAGAVLHFAHAVETSGEDAVTVAYMADTAREAGLSPVLMTMEEIGWDDADHRFVDLRGQPIRGIFHLYPWEWLVREEFAMELIASLDQTAWIEPIWKMIWSNKAILPILHDLFPGHPNLLPASFDPLPGDHVRKPILGREGGNVEIMRGGNLIAATCGGYGEEGAVYQALYPLPDFGGRYPVLGSWVVDGEPAGMGIREDGLITGNRARFVPHIIEG